jgi:hypothetical protein
MDDTRRLTLRRLTEAHVSIDHQMKAAKGNMPELVRLLRVKKGLRLMMEPLAAAVSNPGD